jgi:pSer/pThr/pTyr-binding forkhead associated (FHA) protein
LVHDVDNDEMVFLIKDLDSRNGTFINGGKRIDGSVRLKEGDEIKIGDYVFVFKMIKD